MGGGTALIKEGGGRQVLHFVLGQAKTSDLSPPPTLLERWHKACFTLCAYQCVVGRNTSVRILLYVVLVPTCTEALHLNQEEVTQEDNRKGVENNPPSFPSGCLFDIFSTFFHQRRQQRQQQQQQQQQQRRQHDPDRQRHSVRSSPELPVPLLWFRPGAVRAGVQVQGRDRGGGRQPGTGHQVGGGQGGRRQDAQGEAHLQHLRLVEGKVRMTRCGRWMLY